MSIPFRQAPFKITGGTTTRTLDQRFSDVINAAEFSGLDPTLATDSGPALQAVLDLAFGPPSAPHGSTNCRLNRPVFIPGGHYRVDNPLNLKQVVGGLIYGAGASATRIQYAGAYAGAITPLFNIDGASHLTMRDMDLRNEGASGTGASVINLNWTNTDTATGSEGLHDNHFVYMRLGGGDWVVVIANSGNQGYNNCFEHCALANSRYGYDVRGPQALNNSIISGGGSSHENAFVRCPSGGGSMSAYGFNGAGNCSEAEFVMASGQTMVLSGGRSEISTKLLLQQNGMVTVQAVTLTNPTGVVQVNGGKCILLGNFMAYGSGTGSGRITGSGGELYLSGNYNSTTTPLSGYTGTIRLDTDGMSGAIIP